ncbi:MAG: rhodanese-like domain-containing protein [Pseudomonadota bacterium]|nr:rhodanese-like domain-containing protein [Pseudomonadota bacterium]
MERWFEFMQNHPFLFGTLGVLVVLFFVLENKRSGRKISPQSLGVLLNQENALIIDLRDPKDFREGHIGGSRNIPYSRLKDHREELREMNRSIVMVCQMGQVSGTAAQTVGGQNLYRLQGGILNWRSQGLPLIKSKT